MTYTTEHRLSDRLNWIRHRVDAVFPEVPALTSLLPMDDGSVLIGATTHQSDQPVLLRLDPSDGSITDTGFRFPIKGVAGSYARSVGDKIHNSLIHGTGPLAGRVLIGHGSHVWWDSGGWPFDPDGFVGGAIYAFSPHTGRAECLGVPVQRNTVHGLFGGEGFAVGFSLPDNRFFSVDYATGEMIDFGRLSSYCCHSFVCRGRRAYGIYRRSVGEQRGDLVVSSEHAGFLFVYDHDSRGLKRTDVRVSDLSVNIRFNTGMDSWVATDHGLLGGRVNGELFLIDPETLAIEELGHAISPTRPDLSSDEVRRIGGMDCREITGAERVTSLALVDGDLVIGTAGFPTMRLFVYDLASRRSVDLGPVNDAAEMCYFHDLAVVAEGDGTDTLVVSETDSGLADVYVLRSFDPLTALRGAAASARPAIASPLSTKGAPVRV